MEHTEISRPGYFTFGLLPCEQTWGAAVQVSVNYVKKPGDDSQISADAWVRAPGAYIKAHILNVCIPAVPKQEDMESNIIQTLKNDKAFAENMVEYLSMVVDKDGKNDA